MLERWFLVGESRLRNILGARVYLVVSLRVGAVLGSRLTREARSLLDAAFVSGWGAGATPAGKAGLWSASL